MLKIIVKHFNGISRQGHIRRMCVNPSLRLEEKVLPSIVKSDKKCLRISVFGIPNAGKSTLVNKLMMRSVCATSSKVHTTKVCSSGVYIEGNTQLIFMDTPGVVTQSEKKKYNLHDSYVTSPKYAFENSDVIGVIQDVSNKHTRDTIHSSIVDMIKEEEFIPKILILNKVDLVKTKDVLLSVTKKLTQKSKIRFNDVFMVSAFKGDGIDDLRNYFLDMSKPNDWLYTKGVYTDQSPEEMVTRTVVAKLMDNLSFEIPYKLKVVLQSLEYSQDGSVQCLASIVCPNERICKVVLGPNGAHIKNIAKQCESELRHAFYNSVFMKLSVKFPPKPKK